MVVGEMRQRVTEAEIDAHEAKISLERESARRQQVEAEVANLTELAQLSQKAMEAWKPMIDFNRGPPPVSPQELASAMKASGATTNDVVMLLRLMAGPPRVSASELRDTIRVLFLDQGLQKDSADQIWSKLRALRTARDAQALKAPFDETIRAVSSVRNADMPASPPASHHARTASPVRSVDEHVRSHAAQARLRSLLDSHKDYVSSTAPAVSR